MGRPLHPALKRKNSRKILGGKGKWRGGVRTIAQK